MSDHAQGGLLVDLARILGGQGVEEEVQVLVTDLIDLRLLGGCHHQVVVQAINTRLDLLGHAHQVDIDRVGPAEVAARGETEIGVSQHKSPAHRGRVTPHGRLVARLDFRPELEQSGLIVKSPEERN